MSIHLSLAGSRARPSLLDAVNHLKYPFLSTLKLKRGSNGRSQEEDFQIEKRFAQST